MLARRTLAASMVGGLLALGWPCWGLAQSAPVSLPSGSSLKLRKYMPEPQTALFGGSVRVRGTFQLGWSMDGATPLELELRFVPNRDGWASLPSFEGQSITAEDYIRIRNVNEVGKRLVGELQFKQVASRATPFASGEAELTLSNIVLANECGFHFEASSTSSKPLPAGRHPVAREFKPHC